MQDEPAGSSSGSKNGAETRSGPQALATAPVPRPAALKDSQARHQIQLLERRLAKMARLLEDRDATLQPALEVDEGVASIYKDVQGVQGKGKVVKKKKALMSAIFEANIDLRDRLLRA